MIKLIVYKVSFGVKQNMKKILSLILAVSLSFSLFACAQNEQKEITCDDIIKAYEDAGYNVIHGEHKNENESSRLCYIKVNETDDDSDYIYFTTYFTEEQAKEAEDIDEYNILTWLFALALGDEGRWLKTGTYGNIEYSYYNSDLIKPFEELVG